MAEGGGGSAANAGGLLYNATRWAYQLAGSPPVLDATAYLRELFLEPSTPSGRNIVEVAVSGFRDRGIIPQIQGGTVTQLPGTRPAPPPDSPPPNQPGTFGGVIVPNAAFAAAWILGQGAVDYWKQAQKAKAEAEKKRKKEEAERKKKAEAERKKRAAEEARRRAILTGKLPRTAGRGPITGPWSGNREYDLPRTTRTPVLNPAGRPQMDVFVHQVPSAPPVDVPLEEVRIDPFYRTVLIARNAPRIDVRVGKLPTIKPTQLPKGPKSKATAARGRARRVLAKSKATFAKYQELLGFAAALQTAFAPKPTDKKQPKTAREPVAQPAPLTQPQYGAVQFPQAYPALALQPKTAKCKCPTTKRKKRGPRKLRTVCYKGSFVETARGTRKRKREQIPCLA